MATVTTPLRIGLADHGRTMTLEEFLEAEDRGRIPLRTGERSARSEPGSE